MAEPDSAQPDLELVEVDPMEASSSELDPDDDIHAAHEDEVADEDLEGDM